VKVKPKVLTVGHSSVALK